MKNLRKFNNLDRTMKFTSDKSGFTLIELLVSITIFVIFLTAMSFSYVSIVRAQRQANDVRRLYSDMRSVIEEMSRDVRAGTIDYDCYSDANADNSQCQLPSGLVLGSIAKSSYLALLNKEHTERVFYWYDETNQQLQLKKFVSTGSFQGTGIAEWTDADGFSPGDPLTNDGSKPLFINKVKVKALSFFVHPQMNPYDEKNYANNAVQFQPGVNVLFTLETQDTNQQPFIVSFQTGLSSRVYNR